MYSKYVCGDAINAIRYEIFNLNFTDVLLLNLNYIIDLEIMKKIPHSNKALYNCYEI